MATMQQDKFAIGSEDPISLSIIQRRLKAGTTIHFIRRGQEVGKVIDVKKAGGRWNLASRDREVATGFYTLFYHEWSAETLSRGEALTKLKFRSNADGSITLELL